MSSSVMWFRRDLRLSDNPALLTSVASAGSAGDVVGLFCLDDRLLRPAGPARLAFLYRSLRALDESIGGRLVLRSGDPATTVVQVAREVGADTVHIAEDFGPYGAARDERVEQALADRGAELVRSGSPYAVAPGTVRTAAGGPYKVFGPFSRAWLAIGWPPPQRTPQRVRWAAGVDSGPLPADPDCSAATADGWRASRQAHRLALLGRPPRRLCDSPEPARSRCDQPPLAPPQVGHHPPSAAPGEARSRQVAHHLPHRAVLAGVLRRRPLPPSRLRTPQPPTKDANDAK